MSEPLILLPGDDITDLIDEKSIAVATAAKATATKEPKQKMIGPGLKREDNNRIVAVKCGQLMNRNNNIFWIDSHLKRYIACKADPVIGVVVSKAAFYAKVDIGTNEPAVLSLLAFPNATKKNKGQIEVDDAIYATIITDCPDVETELTCVTSEGKKGGMGVLASTGYVLTVPTNIARRLLAPESNKMFQTLGKKFKFEIAIGFNGRVWVDSKRIDITLTIVNFLASLEHLPKVEHQLICEQLTQKFEQFVRK